KVVRTAREVKVNAVTGAAVMVDANAPQTAAASAPGDVEATQTEAKKQPPKAPSLRRPGEQAETPTGAPLAKDGELGSKPIPTSAPGQEPEWGTKPATPSNTSNTPDPNAPLPGAGQLPPVNPH
ncbi:MAG: hypothetical protein JOZ44_04265, partial [Acidobacteria bacterium]|nr:hypothetical protein [Acidobacteriota bacterium]